MNHADEKRQVGIITRTELEDFIRKEQDLQPQYDWMYQELPVEVQQYKNLDTGEFEDRPLYGRAFHTISLEMPFWFHHYRIFRKFIIRPDGDGESWRAAVVMRAVKLDLERANGN